MKRTAPVRASTSTAAPAERRRLRAERRRGARTRRARRRGGGGGASGNPNRSHASAGVEYGRQVRRVLLIVVVLGLLAGATAIAQTGSGSDAYQLQEPSVSSRQVIR